MPEQERADLTFGQWLRQQRRERDWTQAQFAGRSACSSITVRRIEADDLKPSRQLAEIFARVLDVPPHALEPFIRFAREGAAEPFLKAAAPHPVARHTPVARLPAQLTSLIGRVDDIGALVKLLRQPSVRLVTLTGPPGTGKTRLSLAVAEALQADFADGAAFIPLAAVTDPARVPAALAQALGVRESARAGAVPLLRELQAFLGDKRLLLVLDNFEHIVEGGVHVAGLLSAAPDVRAVVTSREALRVYGEREYAVPPLPTPDLREPLAPDDLARLPSVKLFVERAQAVKHDFALDARNAADVARLCVSLDGLPLAIEMAASHVRRIPPHRLVQQLDGRISALAGAYRDLDPRQQSLRGALDWSHDALDARDQRLFRRLSVFESGAREAEIERVCADTGSAEAPGSLGERLRGLCDKSLLRVEADAEDGHRYGMLAVVRDYAREKLDAAGETPAARAAHAACYLDLAERLAPDLRSGTRQLESNAVMDREQDNMRAALAWFSGQGPAGAEGLGRLATALYVYWENRSHFSDGRVWLEAAVAADPAPTAARARLMNWASTMCFRQGDIGKARQYVVEALAIQQAAGDEHGTSRSLQQLGILAGISGDYAEARSYFERALSMDRRLGEPQRIASSINNLAIVLTRQGDLDGAEALHQEGLAIKRATSNQMGIGHSLHGLAALAQRKGDMTRAERLFVESIGVRVAVGDRLGLANSLEGLAGILADAGQAERAALAVGAAEALRKALNAPHTPDGKADYDALLDKLTGRLGAEAFAAKRAEGRALPFDRAIAAVQGG